MNTIMLKKACVIDHQHSFSNNLGVINAMGTGHTKSTNVLQ